MNLLLHGIESPQIDPLNALRFRLSDIGDRDRVDVIVTNPPFGGEEERGVQGNFPDDRQTAETALLFLQLIMRKLRRPGKGSERGGRAGVVVPNGTLSGDGVAARIKRDLLTGYNLHTVLRLPNGVFSPYTPIPTNVLFFDRSGATSDVWYYEHPLPEGKKNYTKTRPLQFTEFEPLLDWWTNRVASPNAWKVTAGELEDRGYNLDVKNPRTPDRLEHLPPEELLDAIERAEDRTVHLVAELRKLLK
jgi:type I restriction enzyme M protein